MKAPLTQLLVHFDATAHAAGRLEAACRIAENQGAAVTALYAVASALPVLAYSPEAAGAIVAPLRDIDEDRRTAARARFDRVATAAAVHPAWAELRQDPILWSFAQQALYADLLVLGQQDPAGVGSGVPADFAEAVMAESGRPALILPYVGPPGRIGETIAIAWKPTREAARAVAAAIPLLQLARKVHVISWAGDEDEAIAGGLDLRGYLHLRGVEPMWHRQGAEPDSVGELLLSRAFDLDADLLVMGCYGHSRAREWVLGGASRTVLRSMTLPVLMAH